MVAVAAAADADADEPTTKVMLMTMTRKIRQDTDKLLSYFKSFELYLKIKIY